MGGRFGCIASVCAHTHPDAASRCPPHVCQKWRDFKSLTGQAGSLKTALLRFFGGAQSVPDGARRSKPRANARKHAGVANGFEHPLLTNCGRAAPHFVMSCASTYCAEGGPGAGSGLRYHKVYVIFLRVNLCREFRILKIY